MTLVVETGVFDPTANSYASVADADARHGASTSADAWEEYDAQQKEQRLIAATRRLDALFDWAGAPYREDQPLGFPRRSAHDYRGRPATLRGVPALVRDAAIDLALWLPEDVPASGAAEDVIEEITLGPIGVKMAIPTAAAAVVRPLVPTEIILALRRLGDYVGSGVGVGRLVR